jgi:hypothetical protein
VRRHEEMMRPIEEAEERAKTAAAANARNGPPPRTPANPPRIGPAFPLPGPAAGQATDFAAHHASVEASFKKIASALKAFADAHVGEYPVSLQQLYSAGMVDAADLRSPLGPYIYVSASGMKAPLPPKMALVIEVGIKDKRRTILWADGRVETVEMEDYQTLLRESRKMRESSNP